MGEGRPFAHLHVHSEYSILDGACSIPGLVSRAQELGMAHVGLTDHGSMAGALQLYREATKAGVKPVIGIEAYLTADRHQREMVDGKRPKTHHLTLLAADNEGYRNLMKLSSLGYLEGMYGGRPRIDHELLSQHARGVIALTGCLASWTNQRLLDGDLDGARAEIDRMEQIFGADNVYVEFQVGDFADQKTAVERLYGVWKDTKLPGVATGDVHYLLPEDGEPHDAMLCVNTGARLSQSGDERLKFPTQDYYLKSPQEMYRDFAVFDESPDWLARTVEIAERTQVDIELGNTLLPPFPTPNGEPADQYLREQCEAGLRRRYAEVTGELESRLNAELGTISTMGYSEYFLITWDWIAWAKAQGIAVGPGRGSAAGSLVAYTLGITDVDPIEYDLLFERFLNPDRVSMPDIDTDVSQAGRGPCIQYLTEKYGRDRVAQIATFGRMAPRAAIRDAARVLDEPVAVGDKVAKLVPEGPGASFDKYLKPGQDLHKAYEDDATTRRIVDLAKWFEGKVRNSSIHAAAVVIGDQPLTDIVPLRNGDHGEVVTQYEQGDVEDLGLLKMDVLGLRNLDVLEKVVEIIERSRGERIDPAEFPLDDAATFEMIARGDTSGVFQMEGEGMQGAARQVGPTRFEDIVALIALYRPGPMADIPKFAANKKDPSRIRYADERLAPILEDTYGITVYQEQYMLIARKLAGFTPGQADDLRKGIAKKLRHVLDRVKPMFLEGCEKNGVDAKLAAELWEQAERAGDYSFNKSHAVCYAVIAYQTAYLKCHYPAEYMAALISSVMNTKDKVPFYVRACDQMGIRVLPPDVNESHSDFAVVDGNIRFGLTAIKGVGESAVEAMVAERAERPFESVFDLCERIEKQHLNKRVLEALTKAGALDGFGATRKGTLEIAPQALSMGQKQQEDRAAGQFDLFGDMGESEAVSVSYPAIPTEEFSRRELFELEKDVVGLYVSGHPLDEVREDLASRSDMDLLQVQDAADGAGVVIAGMLTEVRKLTTRKGDPMAVVRLEDLAGAARVVVFPRTYEQVSQLLVVDKVVVIDAKVDRKDGDFSLLANEVSELQDAPRRNTVALQMPESALTGDTVSGLQRILREYPGDAAVEITVLTASGPRVFRLGEDWKVNPQDGFAADLRSSFPEDVITFA